MTRLSDEQEEVLVEIGVKYSERAMEEVIIITENGITVPLLNFITNQAHQTMTRSTTQILSYGGKPDHIATIQHIALRHAFMAGYNMGKDGIYLDKFAPDERTN